jgi:hypothetical protein
MESIRDNLLALISEAIVYCFYRRNGQNSEMLKRISPVSWQHINIYGRYEFNSSQESINMNEIIQELAQSKGLLQKVTQISSK